MFFATYKTTMKTLLRSLLLWIVIVIAFGAVMSSAASVNSSYTIVENGLPVKVVYDTDPEYILKREVSIQTYVNGTVCWMMLYVIPVFCVVSTMLVLTRDYSDNFFEIQKSAGTKTFSSLTAKLLAILTVISAVYLLINFVSGNYYYFTRGGVEGLTISQHFADNIARIFRMYVTSGLPSILVYTLITYMFASISKSGFIGGVLGSLYVLLIYCSNITLRSHFSEEFRNYFSPISDISYRYWGFYGSEWHNTYMSPYTLAQVLTWLGIMVGFITLFSLVTYFVSRKRTV